MTSCSRPSAQNCRKIRRADKVKFVQENLGMRVGKSAKIRSYAVKAETDNETDISVLRRAEE